MEVNIAMEETPCICALIAFLLLPFLFFDLILSMYRFLYGQQELIISFVFKLSLTLCVQLFLIVLVCNVLKVLCLI